jgi:putative SOS response-associated peptidase YedK
MCGRFLISKKVDEITERFHVEVEEDKYAPIYNAAPSQLLPVINNAGVNQLKFYKWGLIPFWAKDPGIGNKMINARSETLSEKPAFKHLLKAKRCLIVADGFYEWKKTTQGKTPMCIRLKNNDLFAMAGLWDCWKDAEGRNVHSFCIITCEANDFMKPIHQRMPVIFTQNQERLWLDDQASETVVKSMLKPLDSSFLHAYEVSNKLNNPRNNFEEVSLPLYGEE